MRRKKTAKLITPGQRTGKKKSDFRWTAEDGTIWGSRFEFEIFSTLQAQGYAVRKTDPQDSMGYTSRVVGGVCTQCHSGQVVQEHTYTPDLFVDTSNKPGRPDANVSPGYYIEAKGNLLPRRRSLLRAFRKAQPNVDLRFILQNRGRAGKRSLLEWVQTFLKVPVSVWPELPGTPDSINIVKPKKAKKPAGGQEPPINSELKELLENVSEPKKKTRTVEE